MPRNATATSATSSSVTVPSVATARRRVRVRRLSLLLALLLALAGLAGVGYDAALRAALRPPSATDEASAVCNDLRSQDYDALAGEMDPTPDGGSTGPFDHAAFVAALRAQDAALGPVRACALNQMNGADGIASDDVVFALTLTRARAPAPLGALVVVRREARGQWALSRASTFYYAPQQG
ncbi:MAG TPA: hypothetical protein VGR57_19250 [Ktedonobacterales bacterium]|nr:hypothetical protein [Ktedonobacterales bacterium]